MIGTLFFGFLGIMAKHDAYDWVTIESEYRTNQFSNSELARRHGCSRAAIHLHAKKGSWIRDLTSNVRSSTNAKLVKEDAKLTARLTGRKNSAKNEVELASETRVAVLRSHRVSVSKSLSVVEKIWANLEASVNPESEGDTEKLPLPAQASTAVNLSNALTKLIALERQAFNLNDDEQEVSGLDILQDAMDMIDGTSKGLPGNR